ncbi:MAG: alkane 1-monooxygenase [Wenzhouxiangella sp.]|nr:alkane 1-monooxygenase [Wenzhouxiangella sp.]
MTQVFCIESAKASDQYSDTKRWCWLLSAFFPLLPVVAIGLQIATGWEWVLVLPLIVVYAVVPALDMVLGEDNSNPPVSAVPRLEGDLYYRFLTFLTVPLHYLSLCIAVYWAATASLSWPAWLALAWSAGLVGGLAVNTGHELGHKRTKFEQILARLALAIPGYGHFGVEHNFGHHRLVATPEDSASARFGESIYSFALREIPGGLRRAITIETRRQVRRGRGFWTPRNEILQSWAVTLLVHGALVAVFGLTALVFLLVHNLVAWWQLTSANYVEHYGLLRRSRQDGAYERCQPHHSWNSNHVLSNLLLFHLERHSDHHANPQRRYQSLRDFPDLPRLPSGYFGMFLLAYVPALWFRVMNPRLLALPHVQHDLEKINLG